MNLKIQGKQLRQRERKVGEIALYGVIQVWFITHSKVNQVKLIMKKVIC